MEKILAVLGTLFIGGLVAYQPPVNALLARHVGDIGAAFTSLLLATVLVGALLVGFGQVGQMEGLSEFRLIYLLGPVSGAAVVLGTIITVRYLGATGVVAALVAGQLIVSAILDRYGAVGLEETPLTAARIGGIVLLMAGTLLVTSR